MIRVVRFLHEILTLAPRERGVGRDGSDPARSACCVPNCGIRAWIGSVEQQVVVYVLR